MTRRPSKPWFAAKRYGYGSGFPMAWQGWLVLVAYVAATVFAAVSLAGTVRIFAIAGLLVAMIVICAVKTEGGWRWRWGSRR